MATNSEQNNPQEIDLSFFSKKASGVFESIEYSIYAIFKFLIKNWLLIGGIVLAGAILGYVLDQYSKKSYKHEVVVVPNYGSFTYLYNKIENLDLKDSPIQSVEIEPILDVYGFIMNDWNNLEIAKYLSQNNIQINKYTPNSDVEKFYRYHLITIKTNRKDEGGKLVDSLFQAFNSDPYFLERQKIELENKDILLKSLNKNLENIDKILEKYGDIQGDKSNLNIEMNPDLNALIVNRKNTTNDINRLSVLKLEEEQVIFPTSKLLNIKVKSFPKMLALPIVFFVLFLVGALLKGFFKRLKQKELGKS